MSYILKMVFMVQVLVLYYTRAGNTEALAKAVAEGARQVEGVSVVIKRVDYATVQDLISCNAVAFGSPNYFGYMAGFMKEFFDKAWEIRGSVKGKLAAAFTCGGSTSDSALISIERMMDSFGFEKAAKGVVSSRRSVDQDLDKCKTLGKTLAEAAVKRAKEVPQE